MRGGRRFQRGRELVNFTGGDGDDVLTGFNGTDNFRGGRGSDGITGNGGTDTMIYDDHPSGVTAVIGGGRVSGNSTDVSGANRGTASPARSSGSRAPTRMTS